MVFLLTHYKQLSLKLTRLFVCAVMMILLVSNEGWYITF
jgi:hypothetical protein